MTLALLAAAGVIAGLTGAWSPCSLSVAETLRGVVPRITFAAGALAGGLVTFLGLSLLGASAGVAAPGVAAAIAFAAAAGEATGARVVPQVRRQVPESWRRVLPLGIAGGAYGALLGLGWTTFVLTYAVWALAAVCVVLGDTSAGLAVGLGFGAGRALPVLARLSAPLAERPGLLRGARLADGAALAACALALTGAPALAADVVAVDATDPAAADGRVAWQEPGSGGLLEGPEGVRRVPGRYPALTGDRIAWLAGETVTIARADTFEPLATAATPGATAFATNGTDVVHRAPTSGGGEGIWLGPRLLYRVPAGRQVGRPSMEGTRVVFHAARPSSTHIVSVDIASGEVVALRRERGVQLLNPSLAGGELLYVRASATRQRLLTGLAAPGRPANDDVVYSTWPSIRADAGRERGQGRHRHYPAGRPPRRPRRAPAGIQDTLWTTALTAEAAYVTRLRKRRGKPVTARVLVVPR